MRPVPTVAAALLAALALAASARATVVSPAGVRSPQVAVNRHGATLVAWERRTSSGVAIEARAGPGPLRLGPIHRLAARGLSPRVTIGADGTRAVQWIEFGDEGMRSVRVAVARPGRAFGKRQLLERRRANMATGAVAVQPGGRVVAVWRRTGGLLGYALAPRGQAFGKARDLTATGPVSQDELALDPRDGAVVLSYGTPLQTAPPVNQQAAARTLATTASAFSAPVTLSDPAGLAESRPSIVAGSGGVGVAWARTAPIPTLNLARRTANGTWAPSELIANAAYGPDVFAVGLVATLPTDGSALAAWSISTEPGGRGSTSKQTVVSEAGPSTAFGEPLALTQAGRTFGALAVASSGADAFLATAEAHGHVLLSIFSADGTLDIASLASNGDGDVLLAAAGPRVLLAWQQRDRLRLQRVR